MSPHLTLISTAPARSVLKEAITHAENDCAHHAVLPLSTCRQLLALLCPCQGGSPAVLDACCGARSWWHIKDHPATLYLDNRAETIPLCDGRTITIAPDLRADFRSLPLPDESFFCVLFDPPHLLRAGESSWLRARYSVLSRDTWQSDLARGFAECFRVLRPGGTLVFKWNETQIPLSHVLPLALPHAPLITHSRHKTHFAIFLKF